MRLIIPFIFASTLGLAPTAFAHTAESASAKDVTFHCDNQQQHQLVRGLEITPEDIRIYNTDGLKVVMNLAGKLAIEGESVELDTQGKRAVIEYQTAIRDILPQMQAIALEAIGIAETVSNQVFTEMLGLRKDEVASLQAALEKSRNNLNSYFASDSIRMGAVPGDNSWSNSPLEEEFGEELGAAIEGIVDKAKFRIVGKLIGEMLSPDGSMEAFGERMEAMGKNIEASTEGLATALEGKAEGMCQAFYRINTLESKITQSVPAFGDYELIEG